MNVRYFSLGTVLLTIFSFLLFVTVSFALDSESIEEDSQFSAEDTIYIGEGTLVHIDEYGVQEEKELPGDTEDSKEDHSINVTVIKGQELPNNGYEISGEVIEKFGETIDNP